MKNGKKVVDGIQFASIVGLVGTAVANIVSGVRSTKKSSEPAAEPDDPGPVIVKKTE